jgi:hypothetical protein
MFIIWALVMISLTLVLLNVFSWVIPQPKRDIVVIVRLVAATSLAQTSHLLSLFPIFLLLLLCVTLPLSQMLSLFRSLFHIYLSQPPLHARLLRSRFMRAGHAHQLMPLHHHPYCLQIQCLQPHLTPCILPSRKVNVLAPFTIPSVSLYPLIVYLLHFHVLSLISTISIPKTV